jgi:uncharacterized protein YceH (UPF0502 family)
MEHFPDIQLPFEEARILGCLLEKEVTTPGSYPLTLNSLVLACNQASSREPVTSLSSEEVEIALRGLSQKYLIEKTLGGRTPKYEHALPDVLSMQDSERAVLTVLLLRGGQSTGEIKQRTERMHHFHSLDEVEETLTWFIEYPHGPLVRRIPVGTGRRVETFKHLLSEDHTSSTVSDPTEAASVVPPSHEQSPTPAPEEDEDWRTRIERQLSDLQSQVTDLRSKLGE